MATDKALTATINSMFGDVNNAEAAIAAKNKNGALQGVHQALNAQIKAASMARRNGDSMAVPIYSELLDTAALWKGTVKRTIMSSTYVAIDLEKARKRLQATQKALDAGNFQAANDTLHAIGSDLMTVTSTQDMPLLTARQNLAIAQTDLRRHNDKDAQNALKQASNALSRYSGVHQKQAADLRRQIDQALAGNSSNGKLRSNVGSWWNVVANWFKTTF